MGKFIRVNQNKIYLDEAALEDCRVELDEHVGDERCDGCGQLIVSETGIFVIRDCSPCVKCSPASGGCGEIYYVEEDR